jgi:hypothetical protein
MLPESIVGKRITKICTEVEARDPAAPVEFGEPTHRRQIGIELDDGSLIVAEVTQRIGQPVEGVLEHRAGF